MTMQVIQHIELGSQQNSIEFTSIPNTYTDLLIVFSGRTTSTGTGPGLEMAFNGSTSNFTTRSLQGAGSGSGVSFSTSTGYAGVLNANNTTSNTFNSISIYIPNYTSSANKSFSIASVSEANATAAYQDIIAGLWSQTAVISSIRLRQSASFDLVAGSSATLYGITKGSDGIVTVS